MIVDTSALPAILPRAANWTGIARAILAHAERLMSSVSRLEATMVIEARRPGHASDLETLIERLHPAGHNLADCCSYGLAKARNEPLPFKGNDFSLTNVEPALKG